VAGFILRLEENGVLDHYWKHVHDLGDVNRARRLYSMAMNKKGRQGYTGVVRAMAAQTSIKQKDIRTQMRFIRASPGNLETRIRGAGRHFPLKYFGARQFSFGTRATVWGKSQRFGGAFIFAGHYQSGQPVGGGYVFHRTGKSSYPIEAMFGPAVPVEMLKDEAFAAWERNAQEILVEVERLIAAGL
jgi:hypothetical protein